MRRCQLRPRILLKSSFLILGLALLACLLLLHTEPAGAEDYTVDDDGPANFSSLEEALLEVEEGDRLLVKKGNYPADYLEFRDDITVMGEDREETRLVFTNGSRFIACSPDDSTLSNLNFTCTLEDNIVFIRFTTVGGIRLENCTFHNIGRGIEFWYLWGRTSYFRNNSLQDTCFSLSVSSSLAVQVLDFRDNTVNGRPYIMVKGEENRTISQELGGIILSECDNIILKNINFGDRSSGIDILYSSNITVENCQVETISREAVKIWESKNVTIRNNGFRRLRTLFYNPTHLYYPREEQILYCRENSALKITGNTLVGGGIYITEEKAPQVIDNTITGESGITFFRVSWGIVQENQMEKDGITLWNDHVNWKQDEKDPFYQHDIQGNSLGEKAIYYYLNQSDLLVPEDAGQFLAVGCRNLSLEDATILEAYDGIFLYNCTNFRLTNLSILGGRANLFLVDSSSCRLENIIVRGKMGPYVVRGHNNSFLDCSFTSTNSTSLKFTDSPDTRIENCNISFGHWGLSLYRSHRALVTGCTIMNNTGTGLRCSESEGVRILKNRISGNDIGLKMGPKLEETEIHENNIFNNLLLGIEISVERPPPGRINATNNWWGHETGPKDFEDINPEGKGDEVDFRVDFDPWLTEPVPDAGVPFEPTEEKPGDNDEEDSKNPVLPVLLLLLLGLGVLGLLGRRFLFQAPVGKNKVEEENRKNGEQAPADPNGQARCPKCGGKFDMTGIKSPARFICHFCQEEIELK